MKRRSWILGVAMLCLASTTTTVSAAHFKVVFPDAVHERLITAFCALFNYEEFIRNPDDDPDVQGDEKIPNPETKAQFALRMMHEYARDQLARYEESRDSDQAGHDARRKAIDDFNAP